MNGATSHTEAADEANQIIHATLCLHENNDLAGILAGVIDVGEKTLQSDKMNVLFRYFQRWFLNRFLLLLLAELIAYIDYLTDVVIGRQL